MPAPALLAILAIIPSPDATADVSVKPDSVVTTGTLLDITAEGHTTRVPDIATIRAGVVSEASTAAAAVSGNTTRMVRVLAALKAAGIVARDIATASLTLAPQTRFVANQPPVVTGYQASNTVTIRFRAIDQAGMILDTLVAQGANQIEGPNLAIDQPDLALDEARVDAVKRARDRAEVYAHAAGLHVTRIISIAENGENAGTNSPPAFMRVMAAKASTPIAAGEKDVTVTLAVRFLLD